MRGVRKNRYREATRTLQSGVPDNLRGCWSGLYPYASRSKYQSIFIGYWKFKLRSRATGGGCAIPPAVLVGGVVSKLDEFRKAIITT